MSQVPVAAAVNFPTLRTAPSLSYKPPERGEEKLHSSSDRSEDHTSIYSTYDTHHPSPSPGEGLDNIALLEGLGERTLHQHRDSMALEETVQLRNGVRMPILGLGELTLGGRRD